MNFLKEIRYLFEWLEDNTLSTGALSLWFYLMHINNCCALPTLSGEWLWRVSFSVTNGRIENILNCSERQMMRYRKELEEKGRLCYKPGNKATVGSYTMRPLRPNVVAKAIAHVHSDKKTQVYVYDGTADGLLLMPKGKKAMDN